MCATLLQKQKKEPENTTAFSSTFSEVNFPIQLKWTVAIIMLKAVLLVLRWYLSSNLLMNYLIEMKNNVNEDNKSDKVEQKQDELTAKHDALATRVGDLEDKMQKPAEYSTSQKSRMEASC